MSDGSAVRRADLEAMAAVAGDALAGGAALTRDELTAEIVGRTGSAHWPRCPAHVVLHGGRAAGVCNDDGVTLWQDVPPGADRRRAGAARVPQTAPRLTPCRPDSPH